MPRTLRTSNPVRRGHPLNQARIAWWLTLPHTQGTATWFDIAGTNHATASGVVGGYGWRPTHRPGGRGEFRVQASAGTVTTAAFSLTTNTITMGAWFFLEAAAPSYGGILLTRNGTVASLNFSSSGTALAYQWNGAYTFDSGLVVPTLTWVYGAVAVEPTKATLYLWKNGVLSSSVDTSFHATATFAGTMQIGGDSYDIARNLPGRLDALSIWNRTLTATDILAEIDQSSRGNPDTLNYL